MQNPGMIYGYARVSTAAQLAQLKAAGCEKVFREKITGTTVDRPQLRFRRILPRLPSHNSCNPSQSAPTAPSSGNPRKADPVLPAAWREA